MMTLFDVFGPSFGDFQKLKAVNLWKREFYDSFPYKNLIKTDDGDYILEYALAGYDKTDITVRFDNGVLTVSASHKEADDKEYIHRGITGRSFETSYTVNKDYEIGEVTFKNGILSIQIKKKDKLDGGVTVIPIKE